MKFVLLGYMGSGKSTVAKALSNKLHLPCVDLDDYIEEKEQMTVNKIFQTQGEVYFRLQESKYLKEILEMDSELILSVGGGTPCYSNNMELINQYSRSIYLKGSIPTICQRLRNEKDQRPLIADLNDGQLTEFVAKHLFERRNYYEKADTIINVDGKSLEDLVSESTLSLKEYLK
ncbi:shikimate kinase [Lutimonas zeaxanthinifaciens]|uniref:shikimate kinase n=1 Tax=Lutimonas zeaxanthinifaciens TaxID=3060215 RepID=UPI00265C9C08|nr:shikimate kinase [Lutimonas sp. YSD2104]WKK64551.1 shikimate kinase [Lutimonas sp. YSD2104]